MNNKRKPYRFNEKEVVSSADNVLYDNTGAGGNGDNVKTALDNIKGRVAALEGGDGGGGSANPYAGKVFAFAGDSYTAPGTWCSRMCSVLGATFAKNAAADGGRWMRVLRYSSVNSAYSQAVNIVNTFKDSATKPDVIMLMFGVNDTAGIQQNSSLLGEMDYGKVYYNTYPIGADLDNMTAEQKAEAHDGYGYIRYVNGSPTNKIDPSDPFWKYERATTFAYTTASNKGCDRNYLVDPVEWIYDAECNGSISADTPSSPATDKLDLRYTTEGMQAAIAYLRFHLPNAIIKIGFTPMGIMLGVPNGRTSQINLVCERMKAVAEFYGVDYLETRHCGFSFIVEKDAECIGNGGHPSTTGQQRIGDYMANLLLGKRGSEI